MPEIDEVLVEESTNEEGSGIALVDDEYPAMPDLAPDPSTPYESERSKVKASAKDHRKSLGQAKETKTGPPGSLPSQPYPVPDPKFKVYLSDHVNPNQRTKSLYSWWNLLPDFWAIIIEYY